MISTSDGSLPEDQAKDFLKRKTKEIQEEKDEQIRKIVAAKSYKEGDESLYGRRGQDLNSKIQSGEIKIV